ncbi:Thymidylate kinase [Phycisphaerae bacterium RAS2]|nr:Thymidylate kinase [Phycisphaerae bacterium RAS2]
MSHLQFFGEGLPYVEPADYPGVLITIEGTDGVGRTTQIAMLREWLEVQGYGVVETGWTRSRLIGRTITEAKEGRILNRWTYSLIYAADFADRLEKEILPALRSGFVVLSDRYVFTAFARDTVRGTDRQWVRDLFGFAPIPHLVLYLKLDITTLIRRVIVRGPIDHFEAGMDMAMGDDPYDSFKRYQSQLIKEYNQMADEFGFHTLNARIQPERLQDQIRQIVAECFKQRGFGSATLSPGGLLTGEDLLPFDASTEERASSEVHAPRDEQVPRSLI